MADDQQFQIYLFSKDEVDGDASMVSLLGGKGANLAEMCKLGLPVPAGMTIPTDVCKLWQTMNEDERDGLMSNLLEPVIEGTGWIEDKQGHQCLFSVRSGAPVSMPGMMDTILNVGICDQNLTEYINLLGKRTALDSYRRLIQMLGSTAYGVPMEAFNAALNACKEMAGVKEDRELNEAELEEVISRYKKVFQAATQKQFPSDWKVHLDAAIRAVFNSWMNDRAIHYRQMYGIPESMGTAVTIQAMVFGNRNDKSGSGVMFTRNPANGDTGMYGEFLINAQGEDVVAGIRTPVKIQTMKGNGDVISEWDGIYAELQEITDKLEGHYKDMMDIEFTVEDGVLYMLQCRIGKRSGYAAIKIALDFTVDGEIDDDMVFKRVTRDQYLMATRPSIPASFKEKSHGTGLPASPGVATGLVALSAEAALAFKKKGEKCILVTKETSPDDIAGMDAAEGILTSTGGATCHAAVVARGMDKPCVVGLTDLQFNGLGNVSLNGNSCTEGIKITICGSTGRVWVATEVPVADTSDSPYIAEFRKRALERINGIEMVSLSEQKIDQPRYLSLDLMKTRPDLFLKAVEAATAGVQIIMDIDDPYADLSPRARELQSIFEADDAQDLVIKALLNVPNPAVGNMLIVGSLPTAQMTKLKNHGYSTGGAVKNIAELMSMKMASITDEFVKDVFGTKKAYDQFVKLYEGAGQKLPKEIGKPMHPDFAVFTILSGSAIS